MILRNVLSPVLSGVLGKVLTSVSVLSLFAGGVVGVWFDANDLSTLFQDTAGTTPVTAPGQTVALMRDKSGNGKHATQATAAQRPTYGVIPYGGVRNILVSTDVLATQTVAVGAVAQTLSFTGTGRIVLSGVYVGTLTGTGVSNRVNLSFTPTAGNLTLTVTGSVTLAQLEKGTVVTNYQRSITKYNITEPGKATVGALFTDGIDDGMVTPSINFSGTDKMTVWAGVQKLSDAALGMIAELSSASYATDGTFSVYASNGGPNYGFLTRGTVSQISQNPSTFTAPIANVLTARFNNSGSGTGTSAQNRPQVNGTDMPAVSGTSPGNYSNNPLYLFRRGGTISPFNGIFTGLIVRGAQSSAAQISNGNTYINSTLGAY